MNFKQAVLGKKKIVLDLWTVRGASFDFSFFSLF